MDNGRNKQDYNSRDNIPIDNLAIYDSTGLQLSSSKIKTWNVSFAFEFCLIKFHKNINITERLFLGESKTLKSKV